MTLRNITTRSDAACTYRSIIGVTPCQTPTKIFSAALALWVMSHMFQESVFADSSTVMVKALRIIAFILLLALETSRFSTQKVGDWIVATLLLPFAVSGAISNNTVLFQGLIFCYCARKEIDIRLVLKSLLVVIFGTFVFIIVLSKLGFLDAGDLSESMGGGVRIRSSLGFVWPSRAPNYFLTIIILVILTCANMKFRSRILLAFVLLVFNVIVFAITDSRAPFLLSLIAIVGYISLGKVKITASLRVSRCMATVFIVSLCGLLIATVFFNEKNELFVHLNALLSGRLRYSNIGIENYRLTLFGSSLVNTGDPLVHGYFDSGYLRMFYTWGVIPSVLFLSGITLTLYLSTKEGDFALSFVLVLLAVHSTIEGRLVLLNYSPFLLYMGPTVFEFVSRTVVNVASRFDEKR